MCESCGCGFSRSEKPVSTAHTIATLGAIPVVVVETTAANVDAKGADEDFRKVTVVPQRQARKLQKGP